MSKVLIVGCGDLGGEVARRLLALNIQTIAVKRSASKMAGMTLIQADVTQPLTLAPLKAIGPEIVIYCVAASGQTDAQYQAQYVEGLRHLLATQVENAKLKHIFFVSSTRVYGQSQRHGTEPLIAETDAAMPIDFGGKRLLEAEALLSSLPCSSTVLRLSGIYGPGRLRMINLAKTPESWPPQNTWTNRIHRDDAAAFIVFLLKRVLAIPAAFPSAVTRACYIVTDSTPVAQYEVLNWLAAKLSISRPSHANLPITGGKRLSNKAMLATGFTLQYPDYQTGYRALLIEHSDQIFPYKPSFSGLKTMP